MTSGEVRSRADVQREEQWWRSVRREQSWICSHKAQWPDWAGQMMVRYYEAVLVP
jgi:hypothetical protein